MHGGDDRFFILALHNNMIAEANHNVSVSFIRVVDSSNFSVRGLSARERADPTDANPAEITSDPQRIPRIDNCTASSLRARSLKSRDGRNADCASWHAGSASCHNSRCDHIWRNGGGAATSRLTPGIRRSPSRWV